MYKGFLFVFSFVFAVSLFAQETVSDQSVLRHISDQTANICRLKNGKKTVDQIIIELSIHALYKIKNPNFDPGSHNDRVIVKEVVTMIYDNCLNNEKKPDPVKPAEGKKAKEEKPKKEEKKTTCNTEAIISFIIATKEMAEEVKKDFFLDINKNCSYDEISTLYKDNTVLATNYNSLVVLDCYENYAKNENSEYSAPVFQCLSDINTVFGNHSCDNARHQTVYAKMVAVIIFVYNNGTIYKVGNNNIINDIDLKNLLFDEYENSTSKYLSYGDNSILGEAKKIDFCN